jgi:16S rRNA processing protein RimM
VRAVGTIGKPHGIGGDVYVRTGFPELYVPGAAFVVASQTVRVVSARHHGNRFLVRFEHIRTRDQAEGLRGEEVLVDRDVMPGLAEDEYLIEELLGRRVTIVGSNETATIVDVITSSPQHRLVLDLSGRRLEVPFHPAIVGEDGGELSIDPPPGLLD